MKIKLPFDEFPWMVFGVGILILTVFFVLHFQTKQNPTQQLVFKAKRLDLLAHIRLTLASASESEKSAVMAVTDQESKIFADQAFAATTEVEHKTKELSELLKLDGTQKEKDLLIQFSTAFENLHRIDSNLLDLAVKNTNIKAYGLTFGPAADAIKEMGSALSSFIEKETVSKDARSIMSLAFGAQIAALHIEILLPPHIYEENDKKMDELEAFMSKEDQTVRKDLDALVLLQNFRDDPYIKTAISDYTLFNEIKKQILLLSRENTNVRSLAISLSQKREALILCQDFLSTLNQTIMEEPVSGVNYGIESNPRSFQIKK